MVHRYPLSTQEAHEYKDRARIGIHHENLQHSFIFFSDKVYDYKGKLNYQSENGTDFPAILHHS